ncbi:MAG: hypothetical protein MJ108_06645 [Saccharofermentans sp.]|nr:hypothetical protein [Saccharofermentans sp.]
MRRKFARFLSVILASSMMMGISSCKAEQKTFPELSFADSETTAASEDPEATAVVVEDTNRIINISVAVPYSDETMNRLLKLYYLKQTDLMPEGSKGADIDVDFLDSVSTPWILNVINTPSDGISYSSVESWYKGGNVPDIYLVNDFEAVVDGGYAANISNYINGYDMSSSSLYGNALVACMNDSGAFGIPMYQTFMMLFGTSDYVNEDGELPFRNSYNEFKSFLGDIKATYGDETGVVPFAKGYELAPYITNGSYMLKDDYRTNASWNTLLVQDIYYIDYLYKNDLTADIDDFGSDPTISRSAALWLDSSANVQRWSDYYPDTIYYTMLPCNDIDSDLELYASVYPLCLSTKSSEKSFAANFAAFMCFDMDALMLLNRLEPQIGYYPITDSDMVWDIICSNEAFGSVSMIFRQNIQYSYYCPTKGSSLEQKVDDYCSYYFSYEKNHDDDRPEFDVEGLFK